MRSVGRSKARGRRLLAAGGFFAAAMSLVFACGFPDVRFGDVDGIDDVDGTSPEAGADVDAQTDVFTNPDAPGDEVEAGVREDGQAKVDADAPCPGANPCDCDNDGYQAEGETCAGNDCDDRDPVVHPNQTYYAEPPEPPNEGNWDCTDPIEKQYVVNLNCAALLGLGCNRAQGFVNDPPCGEVADYYECQPGVLSCNAVKIGTRRQGCK